MNYLGKTEFERDADGWSCRVIWRETFIGRVMGKRKSWMAERVTGQLWGDGEKFKTRRQAVQLLKRRALANQLVT